MIRLQILHIENLIRVGRNGQEICQVRQRSSIRIESHRRPESVNHASLRRVVRDWPKPSV